MINVYILYFCSRFNDIHIVNPYDEKQFILKYQSKYLITLKILTFSGAIIVSFCEARV